jgi:hypothetical protein
MVKKATTIARARPPRSHSPMTGIVGPLGGTGATDGASTAAVDGCCTGAVVGTTACVVGTTAGVVGTAAGVVGTAVRAGGTTVRVGGRTVRVGRTTDCATCIASTGALVMPGRESAVVGAMSTAITMPKRISKAATDIPA